MMYMLIDGAGCKQELSRHYGHHKEAITFVLL